MWKIGKGARLVANTTRLLSWHHRVRMVPRLLEICSVPPQQLSPGPAMFLHGSVRLYSSSLSAEADTAAPSPPPEDPLDSEASAPPPSPPKITPMMQQYFDVKDDPLYKGHLVLFQMGEFYECFFEDAATASRLLGIALTRRGRHKGTPIPMAGIPAHTRDSYVARLVRAGQKVVICDQVESVSTARSRGSSALVRRAVTRVVTAGTVTEDAMLPSRSNNYLAAVCPSLSPRGSPAPSSDPQVAIAWMDVSTGAFFTAKSTLELLSSDLSRYPPAEVLVPAWANSAGFAPAIGISADDVGMEDCTVTPRPLETFSAEAGAKLMAQQGRAAGAAATTDGLERTRQAGSLSKEELGALAAVLSYVQWTQQGSMPSLIHVGGQLQYLEMDASTRRSLELIAPVGGKRRQRGSLLHCVDSCRSTGGSRLLETRLRAPLADVYAINGRLDSVEWFLRDDDVRDAARDLLRRCADLERVVQRVALSRASPRDLGSIRDTLVIGRQLGLLLDSSDPLRFGAVPVLDSHDDEYDVGHVSPASVVVSVPEVSPSSLAPVGGLPVRVIQSAAVDFDQISGASDFPTRSDSEESSTASKPKHGVCLPSVLRGCVDSLLQPLATSQLRAGLLADAHAALSAALVDDPPASMLSTARGQLVQGKGGSRSIPFIRKGYHPELDELRDLRDHNHRLVGSLQQHYQSHSGVSSLKIKRTLDQGFAIEVPTKHVEALQKALPETSHMKTLKTGVRFKTPNLVELDRRSMDAESKVASIEAEVFRDLCSKVTAAAEAISAFARALSVIDVYSSLAQTATIHGLVRPSLSAFPGFQVDRSWHLVVQRALAEDWVAEELRRDVVGGTESEPDATSGSEVPVGRGPRMFVPNGLRMVGGLEPHDPDSKFLWLITGPNMGGKSTFLRQAAHLVVLAQAGCFVPAINANIGVVDKLFSRVGASDDLARDQSTFMVEMMETARILKQATPRSFVVIDEVGRGTSTSDGLAIAWAVLEDLCNRIGCRTLFATHFHELSAVASAELSKQLRCMSMEVFESDEGPILTHSLVDGPTSSSFGVSVARRAGVPEPVVARAEQILQGLDAVEASNLWQKAVVKATEAPSGGGGGGASEQERRQ